MRPLANISAIGNNEWVCCLIIGGGGQWSFLMAPLLRLVAEHLLVHTEHWREATLGSGPSVAATP